MLVFESVISDAKTETYIVTEAGTALSSATTDCKKLQ